MPIVLLVPMVLAVTALSWEAVTRREAEQLVAQRQTTALTGLNAQLKERRQANETISYLLAKRDTIETALDAGNTLRLAQTLVLMQAALDITYINVYGSNGARMLQLGGNGAERIDGPLVASAILGKNHSAVTVGEKGLIVAAASAVSGRNGTAGVIVVGTAVAAHDLRGDGPSGEDVAVFRSGHLIETSLADSAPLGALEEPVQRGELDNLNGALASSLHMRAAGTRIDTEGVLVALVPVTDLEEASRERARMVIGGTLALLITLILMATLQARAIARPVDSLVGVAGALMRGDYRRRVAPTRNFELHELGQAVNHLAGELERKVAELTRQATHDPLSGLPNRLHFVERVDRALAEVAPNDAVAVLFLDLDNFKIVNDSLGHGSGDRLIVAVAERLRRCLDDDPAGATIARLGGDEFTLLMPHAGDGHAAIELADCVLGELATPFLIDEHELFVSASIGIALSSSGPTRASDLLRAADVAMYRAKTSGRSQRVVYDGTMGRNAADRLELETELRRAIERNSLIVYYQPIVDLATGRVAELEALVRWDHPRRGFMSPAAFIPLAEETGLIVPLGRWVLEQACFQARQWQHDHPSDPPLTVSVNLSARQLQQPDLATSVREILQASGLDPSCLKLEITESVLMQDSDAARLASLAALGIHLAIDDFGTGYSSLAYLSRLPIDTLKIDRSFVSRLGHEPESDAVVRTIVALAHTLNLSVTAEGIEQPEQAARLRALGCHRGQGYFFARPAAPSNIDLSGPLQLRAA
ncbi:MAG TPA: EAL domain-containing protein [Chloroflexota bacterium]